MKKSIRWQSRPFSPKAIFFTGLLLLTIALNTSAQNKKANYNSCFLADSVDQRLAFIEQNAWRIFTDTASCKEALLDTIAKRYADTKDAKYLEALSAIRQNPNARVEDYYTDIITRFIENDFAGFLQQLYIAHGRLAPLETEMIVALNMIVNGHPLKLKYAALLDAEIAKANQAKDSYKAVYLQKLKQKIQAEKLR